MPRPRKLALSAGVPPMEQWPAFDGAGLSEARRRSFENNRTAVALYLQGEELTEIQVRTGLDGSRVRKLILRCLQRGEDGTIAGLSALVPYRRRRPHQRTKSLPSGEREAGFAGAFEMLLRTYPSVREAIEQALQGKALRPGCARHYAAEAYAAFLRACAAQGLAEANCYPFNTQSIGVQAVRRYVRDYVARHLGRMGEPLLGRRVAAKLHTGDGRHRPALALFERVECDAHLLDQGLSIMVRHPNGHYVARRLHRLWVVVLMEVRSRSVLGYSLSLGRQPSSQDLLDAVHMALSPWHPYRRLGEQWRYSQAAGFPSGIEGLRGLGFRELSVDGARMNLARDVVDQLAALMGARVTHLSRGTPDDRPFIERYFRTLEQMGFHRLRGTTGSYPADPRRLPAGPPGDAHRLDWVHLPAILDHLIAEYNGAPHTSLGEVSPLDYLRQMAGTVHPECRVLSQSEIDNLQFAWAVKTIRGSLAQARAPYVEYGLARYGGGPLALSYNLIGQKVRVRVNVHDARVASLFSLGGEPLGEVYAAPPWHEHAHSLRLRCLIQRRTQARACHLALHADPIQVFATMGEASLHQGGAVPDGYLALQRSLALQNVPLAEPCAVESAQRSAHCVTAAEALPAPRPAAQRHGG